MDIYTIFKSLLIFLLLCYGKKFIDANESQKTEVVSQQSAGSSSTTFTLDSDDEDSGKSKAEVVEATSGSTPQPRQRAGAPAQRGNQGGSQPVTISLDDDDDNKDSKPQAQAQAQPQAAAQGPRQIRAVAVGASSAPAAQPRARAQPQAAGQPGQSPAKGVSISLEDDDDKKDSKPQAQAQAQPQPKPQPQSQPQPQAQAAPQGPRQIKAVPVAAAPLANQPKPAQTTAAPAGNQPKPAQTTAAPSGNQPKPQSTTTHGTTFKYVSESETGTEAESGVEIELDDHPQPSGPEAKPSTQKTAPAQKDTKTETGSRDSTPQRESQAKLPLVKPSRLATIPAVPEETDAGSDIDLSDPSPPQPQQAQPAQQPPPQQVKQAQPQAQPAPQPQSRPAQPQQAQPQAQPTPQAQPQVRPVQAQPAQAQQPRPQAQPSPQVRPQAQPSPQVRPVQQPSPQVRAVRPQIRPVQPQQVQPQPQAQPAQQAQPQARPAQSTSPLNMLNISEPVEITTSSGTDQISVNDRTKFGFEEYAYGYLFKFSNANRCVGIKYGDKEIWKYAGNPENVYPKSICLRKDNPVILFEFEGCYYLYGCVENKFKFIHYDEFYAVYNKIKVITQNLGKFNENDTKAYDVIHYGLMFEYRFKHNHLCSEVMYNDKKAWSYDFVLYGDNFPTVLYFDVISPIMISLFITNTPYVFINHNEEWKGVEEVFKMQSQPVLPSKVPATPRAPSLKSAHDTPSTGKTIEIEDSEAEGPPSVSASQTTHVLPDTDAGSEIEIDTHPSQPPSPGDAQRPRVPHIRPSQVQEAARTTQLETDGSDLDLGSDIEVTEVRRGAGPSKQAHQDYDEFPIETQEEQLFVHQQPVKLVVLDIQDMQTTRFINYSYDVMTKTHIYTPKPTYSIKEVKMDDYVFWNATNDNYGFGVIFIEDLSGKPFLKVFIPEKDDLDDNEKTKIIEKEIEERTGKKPMGPPEADDVLIPPDAPVPEEKPSEEESTERKMPIMVDITKKDSTEQYDYSKRNPECGMYTPKHNFIFKLVKASRLIRSDVEIWCPESEEEYVTKVFIDLLGILSDTYNVTLFLVNGNVKHFTLLNERWIEVDPAVLLDISKTQSTYEFDCAKDEKNDIMTFTPRGHFLFKGVKRTHGMGLHKSVVDIWNAKNRCDYARKAVVKSTKKSEKYLLLYLISGGYKLFYRSDKGKIWRDESANLSSFNNLRTYGIDLDEESMDKVAADKYLSLRITDGVKIPVTLNIENKKNANEFYYVVNGPIVSYIPKHNIVFDNLVYKSSVHDVAIWTAQDAYQHAYRVVMGNNPWNPYKKRSMALILLNGNFTFFEEFEDYVDWRDTTETRYSLLKLKMYALDRDLSGRYREIGSGEYKINSLAFLYGYTFNPGVECLEIRYRNLPIWKYGDNTRGGFPRGIYLNIANNGFYIKYFDRWMFVDMDQARAKYSKATPASLKKMRPETPKTYALSCPLLVTNIRVTTLIGGKPFVHHLSHFTLLEGYLVSTFEFTEKLFKVEYAEKTVWKHKLIRYGTHYPNKLYFDHLGYLIVSFTDNWYYVYEYSVERWKIVCKNEIDKPDDLPGMAIITDEVQPLVGEQPSLLVPGKPERPQEVEDQHIRIQAEIPKPSEPQVDILPPADKSLITLDLQVIEDDRYEISYLPNKVIYRAKAPNLFGKVKSGNEVLWSPTRDEYPYKVIYKEVDGKDKLKVYFPTEENPILGKIRSERR
ncbi:hypothetical protein MACJ_001791 [Theileria orientalis]|uniref:Uncharacterized protein n=1 Tax=Theileria orientalis TaxID=68886 RepID=A0A976QQ49_THEOR|nr:hypothetical protein MACJ_001791 [Theileria orientalis]